MGKWHGGVGSHLYDRWKHIRQRCNNPRARQYPNYGGRGITVCEEWNSFEVFRRWALSNGYRPHLQIDRIDNDGPYSPENCRWTTLTENLRNNRHVHYVEAFGERKALSAWAEDLRCQVSYWTLKRRLAEGWSSEEAITKRSGPAPDLVGEMVAAHKAGASWAEIARDLNARQVPTIRRGSQEWHSTSVRYVVLRRLGVV